MEPFDPEMLRKLANVRMPFGKYAGRRLIELPEPYVCWFARKGFPRGALGEQLRLLHVVKENGLEHLIRPLIEPER